MAEGLRAPGYLPDIARPLLPWCRKYVATIAGKHHVPLLDVWDEAICALVRATVYYDQTQGPGSKGDGLKAFSSYACLSVIRGCWRYSARQATRQQRAGIYGESDTRPRALHLRSGREFGPSAEAEAIAREQAAAHPSMTVRYTASSHSSPSSSAKSMADRAAWSRK